VGERASLAGIWDGEFIGNESDRSGTIHFELEAGQDSAYGDVLIMPRQWLQAGRISGSQRAPAPKLPELIRINFVYITDNFVRGTLEEYYDSLCGCTLTTVFDGTLTGNEIKGSYETRYPQGAVAFYGTWTVRRVSPELYTRVDRRDAVR
jgi:hypothetical protein